MTPEEQSILDDEIKRERNEEYLREYYSALYDKYVEDNYDSLKEEYFKDEIEGSDNWYDFLHEKYNDSK